MDKIVLPQINPARCNGCGVCVLLCPGRAVELRDGLPVIVRPHDCAYCGTCEERCPSEAIALPYEITRQPKEKQSHDR